MFGALSPIGPVPLAIGAILIVLGTVLSAPDAGRRGEVIGSWWSVLALAALVLLAGVALEVVWPGLGRLLVVPASAVALVTAGLTVPSPLSGRTRAGSDSG